LVATEDHCIHTPDGWKALSDLKRGMRVGIARRLSLAGASQSLPQTYARAPAAAFVARAGRRYSPAFIQNVLDAYQSGMTATAVGEEVGVRWQTVLSFYKLREVATHVNG